MPPFLQNLLALPAKTKAVLGVSAVAILAIAFIMLKIATAPSYALIASGLDPAQTGKITAALDEQGIAYELRNNGTALAVDEVVHGAGAHRARRRRACRPRAAARSRATSCSTSPSSAPRSSSSRSPTSARWRVRSPGRSAGVEGVSNPTRADRACRRTTCSPTRPRRPRRDPARQLRRHARARRRARHGAARRLLRQGPQDRQRDDHRLQRRDPVAVRRRPAARRRRLEQAGRRGALRPPDGDARSTRCSRRRSARARPRSRSTPTSTWTRPREEELTYGKKGVPLTTDRRQRDAEGRRRRQRGGTAGTGSNVPTYSGTSGSTPPARGNYKSKKGTTDVRRRQEGHQDRDRRRRASTSSTSR